MSSKYFLGIFSGIIITVALLSGCGSGGDGVSNGINGGNTGGDSGGSIPMAVSPSVSSAQLKVLTFVWNDVGADHYKLLKNPDGISGYTQVGADINSTRVDEEIPVHLQDWLNASYIVQACNASDVCTDSAAITATSVMLKTVGYFKASNTGADDNFGFKVALSADGNTLAVGTITEDSAAKGINGNQADNTASGAGAVYVFTRSGTMWGQQAYVKASNTAADDRFGFSVALSADGNTLAVGADDEDSAATGINGNQADNSASGAGAVYVFTRSGTAWSQQAYVKASNTGNSDSFGWSVSLSADGDTLAVGAYREKSVATGINGNQADNSATAAGAVYVFTRNNKIWNQQAYVKASNTDTYSDNFGASVALSADGDTLAVGAQGENSAATGINGNQADNNATAAGAAYVFTRSGTMWSQQAYVKASNTQANDSFGRKLALSADGNTLAVGAYLESSATTGINGNQADNSALRAGAVYVFTRSGSAWGQQAYMKSSNIDAYDYFSADLALSADGNILAVGAHGESSAATGINGNQTDNSVAAAGAVYVFTRSGTTWNQHAYVKASNTGADYFSASVALSADGETLAVGASSEDSSATGVNGNQTDNSTSNAGAVYLY